MSENFLHHRKTERGHTAVASEPITFQEPIRLPISIPLFCSAEFAGVVVI
jgi:hypothetical protein